jgi:hypothetical protein
VEEPFGAITTLDGLPLAEGDGYVLVVPDPALRKSTAASVLTGHTTVVARSGADAQEVLRTRPDAYLVVLELAIPFTERWDERVERLLPDQVDVPVYVISAVPGDTMPTVPLSKWFPKPIARETLPSLADDLRRRFLG